MPAVLAVFAHPDDIEFRAAGTLLLLRDRGWDVHYCNLSNGDLGSSTLSRKTTAETRAREAQASCQSMGFHWHPPIASDLCIFYTDALIRRVAALVRSVQPSIVLTHPPMDYMEDHTETCRIAVTAAFSRGMPNYRTIPARKPTLQPLTLYHSLPHGLQGPLRQPVRPEFFVDTTSVHARKRAGLAAHASQKEWLDVSQGMESYLISLDQGDAQVGLWSGRFAKAEGWTRHLHLGFGAEADDPLQEAIGNSLCCPAPPAPTNQRRVARAVPPEPRSARSKRP
ncbi:MAG: PIG-L family deacetylase [Verrucomicrobia bacterium]|nr:PIG-L family deacetylase [Verrucomicrobiota bacterium]